MKTNKTLKTVALASLMGSALLLTGCGSSGGAGGSSAPIYIDQFKDRNPGFDLSANLGTEEVPDKTTSLSYDLPYIGTVTANVTDLVDAHRFLNQIPLGDVTFPQVWGFVEDQHKQLIVDEINNRFRADDSSHVDLTLPDVENLISANSNELNNIKANVWEEAAAELNSTFAGTPISASEARTAFDQINAVGATEAWALGWTGKGINITSVDGESGTPEALITARAIAIGSETTNGSSDIRILDMNSVSLERDTGGAAVTHSNSASDPFSAGRFAGVSALVMQKFPGATNLGVDAAVSSSVVDGRYNALNALSPSF